MHLRKRAVGAVAALLVGVVAASTHASTGTPIKATRGTQLTAAPWHELTRSSSRRSQAVAFARGFLATPAAFAFKVTATSMQRVKVFWSVYCEGYENDEIFTPQGSFKMMAPFTAYPPVLASAAKCFLTVKAAPTRPGKARTVLFGY
jgi:hypothetical protein